MPTLNLLPGISESYVRARLERSPGNELSGKFASPVSSASLAANCFAWFHEKPGTLPPLPELPADCTPERIDIEYKASFPWRGGHHPWLDAVVVSQHLLIGIESKRYEPFRDRKSAVFSDAYDRPVWGDGMAPFGAVKDRLKSGDLRFAFLDAAQLVKHALGLATEAGKAGLKPCLFYLFAEPAEFEGRPIDEGVKKAHRDEIQVFADAVDGASVLFRFASYRDWIDTWKCSEGDVRDHGQAILQRFDI